MEMDDTGHNARPSLTYIAISGRLKLQEPPGILDVFRHEREVLYPHAMCLVESGVIFHPRLWLALTVFVH
jgi:hypothetical protein